MIEEAREPAWSQTTPLAELVEGVNGFAYSGDRLNAIVSAVSWLGEHPDHLRALFPEFHAAGVREGIRRAREAAANVDRIESALSGADAAVWAIDALEAEK